MNKKLHGKESISIKNFSNVEGKVTSRISNKLRKFARELEDFNKQMVPLNDKLKEAYIQLMNDYDSICKTFSNLSDITRQIHNLHENYNKKVEFGKSTINQNIYASMTNTYQSLQKHYTEKITSIQETMLKNVKYTKHEIFELNEVMVLFYSNIVNQNEEQIRSRLL